MLKTRSLLPALLVIPLAVSVVARSAQKSQADQAMPAPNAEAVWKHLEASNYGAWAKWPGTRPFYPGTSPHGSLLTTFVNEPAMTALRLHAERLPHGSLIVKQNYNAERQFLSMTVMYKAPAGYDPEHNDWFWMKRMPDGEVTAQGKVEACIGCHSAGTDYTLTEYRAERPRHQGEYAQ